MTRAHQDNRTKSLGASLLDQVLAETLDPSYAEAAAARASGRAKARPAQRGWSALAAVVMVMAGLLIALTYNAAAASAPAREEQRTALIADINRESMVTDDLVATLAVVQAEVSDKRNQALSASVEGQLQLERVQAAEMGAAALPVTGPGLLVTLGNAVPSAADDPVATDADQPEAAVLDRDLQLLVNTLWSAGAEAISIDGQRLGPTTTIRQAGGAILVDLRPVTSPYEVLAIGNQDAVYNEFLASPSTRYLGELALSYDWVFDFARRDDLELPAGSSTELRYAEPRDDAN